MLVSIVSPSPSRREALRRALESDEVRVVTDRVGSDADDGVRLVPDVLLLDGEEALQGVRESEDEWPPALVLLIDEAARAAIEKLRRLEPAGWTVLPPDARPSQLRAGVIAAAAGLVALPGDWQRDSSSTVFDWRTRSGTIADNFDGADAGEDDEEAAWETLTPREVEVLEWMARGLSNRQVGLRLGISEHTAKFHVASVLGKLGAHNRADAVRRGIRRGLVTI